MKERKTYYLGDLLELCTEVNSDLKYGLDYVRGVSNTKEIQVTRANMLGRDLSKFHIVHRNEFVYNRRTSRNGERVGLGFNETDNTYIFTEDYVHFKVKDESIILSKYLYLFFLRTEFDREARFNSWGSATEMFNWKDMQAIKVSVPPIMEQRRIVNEYQTVERRIRNNETLIQKLEETAQAIYYHTFVEGIDEENLPSGWRKDSLYNIAEFLNGKACQDYNTDEDIYIPVLKIKELSQGYTDGNSDKVRTDFPADFIIKFGDLVFSWSATLLIDFWCFSDAALNQHLFKVSSKEYPQWFCYLWIKHYISIWKNIISAKAVSMGHIKKEDLQAAEVLIPTDKEMKKLDGVISPIYSYIKLVKQENIHLRNLLTLLTSKLS